MTLPLYILRRTSMPGGNRLRKLVKVEPEAKIGGICPICLGNVVYKRLIGFDQLDGITQNGIYWHYKCRPPVSESYVTNNRHVSVIKPPKGNLGEEEYRFWIGNRESFSSYAMCRACRTCTYGAKEREAHFSNSRFAIGGEQCTVRLTNCYKLMENTSQCLVCKKQRFQHKKWGVPICDSQDCITAWKFSPDKWVGLEVRLRAQVRRAEIKEAGSTPRIMCEMCHLFTDNEVHDEIHTARLMSGNYDEDAHQC